MVPLGVPAWIEPLMHSVEQEVVVAMMEVFGVRPYVSMVFDMICDLVEKM